MELNANEYRSKKERIKRTTAQCHSLIKAGWIIHLLEVVVSCKYGCNGER